MQNVRAVEEGNISAWTFLNFVNCDSNPNKP